MSRLVVFEIHVSGFSGEAGSLGNIEPAPRMAGAQQWLPPFRWGSVYPVTGQPVCSLSAAGDVPSCFEPAVLGGISRKQTLPGDNESGEREVPGSVPGKGEEVHCGGGRPHRHVIAGKVPQKVWQLPRAAMTNGVS